MSRDRQTSCSCHYDDERYPLGTLGRNQPFLPSVAFVSEFHHRSGQRRMKYILTEKNVKTKFYF